MDKLPKDSCPNKFCRHLVRFGPPEIGEWHCLRDMHYVRRMEPWALCPDYDPIAPDCERDLYYGTP